MNKLDAIILQRTNARKRIAQKCVDHILSGARDVGIDIKVIGSFANNRFRAHSDVDLFVGGSLGPKERAAVESLIASHMRDCGIPYDLIFAADLTQERIQELLSDSL